jgi:hypothetical protein
LYSSGRLVRHHFRKRHATQVAHVSTVASCLHDPHELHCYCLCHRVVCPTNDQVQINRIALLRVALEVSAHSFEQRATVAVAACCGCDCGAGQFAEVAATAAACCCCGCRCGWGCACVVRPMGAGCWPCLCSAEDWAHGHSAQALGLPWLCVARNRLAERRRHRMRPSAHALG